MENQWKNLPMEPRYVAECDKKAVAEFNKRYKHLRNAVLQTQLLPEPFLGSPDAPVYLLNSNPGFGGDEDEEWHADRDFRKATFANLNHEPSEYPFYFLDPRFAESPGGRWWSRRMNQLIRATSRKAVAQCVFCVELHGYHSNNFHYIPQAINGGKFPSMEYSFHLVREAIKEEKWIIIMRGFRLWNRYIQGLSDYKRLVCLKNHRRTYLTEKNLPNFASIVETIGGRDS